MTVEPPFPCGGWREVEVALQHVWSPAETRDTPRGVSAVQGSAAKSGGFIAVL